jgi:hypothetical protein
MGTLQFPQTLRGSQPPQTPQAPRAPQAYQAPSAPRASSGREMTQAPSLNFSVPEEGSLFSRLYAGLSNIGYLFKAGPRVRMAGAGEFQFLLPEESLGKRITREFGNALVEFKRNPRQFFIDFIKGEGTNRYRRNALLAGAEMAGVGLFTLYLAGSALGRIGKGATRSRTSGTTSASRVIFWPALSRAASCSRN